MALGIYCSNKGKEMEREIETGFLRHPRSVDYPAHWFLTKNVSPREANHHGVQLPGGENFMG